MVTAGGLLHDQGGRTAGPGVSLRQEGGNHQPVITADRLGWEGEEDDEEGVRILSE